MNALATLVDDANVPEGLQVGPKALDTFARLPLVQRSEPCRGESRFARAQLVPKVGDLGL